MEILLFLFLSALLPFPADALQFRFFFIASITLFSENLELSEN